MKLFFAALVFGVVFHSEAALAQACPAGVRVEGVVSDSNGGRVAGAVVTVAHENGPDGASVTTDGAGAFALPCLPAGAVTLTVVADTFETGVVRTDRKAGQVASLKIKLAPAHVETTVQVDGDDSDSASNPNHSAGSRTLGAKQIVELADDPDDFQRQLQVLAASSGGSPGSATITVDGFQNASALPPKGSIAAIRVNPDSFSAEYENPPYNGGHIDIITKAGAGPFHGALFLTDSDALFNATDAFSTTSTPAGKRRYGFEFSGPLVKKKSDFSLALEKRDIDEFSIVNATVLGANGQTTPLHEAVTAPQRLWIASARTAMQAGENDTAALSFSANTNTLGNQGVGGLTLPEAGYGSVVGEYNLRFNNTQTFGANVLHQSRAGFTWKRTEQTPLSTAPQLQVAGYFTSGGATSQALNRRERDLEVDDDLGVTKGKHSMKVGVQSFGYFLHYFDPDTFNGSFVFGGGGAPVLNASGQPTGQTTTIDGLEQYRRALAGQSGGAPTTYQVTSGAPLLALTQWRVALYAQDAIKLGARVTVSGGLRYNLQTTPSSFGNFGPRVGLAWSVDKKAAWVVHVHAGLFVNPRGLDVASQVYRLNGVLQSQILTYAPNFQNPLAAAPGSVQLRTMYLLPHGLAQATPLQAEVSVEHTFPHHFTTNANFFFVDNWAALRIRNINAPEVATSVGAPPDPAGALLAPRPLAAGVNMMQYQASGHFRGPVFFTSIANSSFKRFNFFAGYVHLGFQSDVGFTATSPQSSYSDKGERAQPDGIPSQQVFGFGTLNLPGKVALSTQFDASSGRPFNALSGVDANGDGFFNDRPSYSLATGSGVYATRYGLLTTNAVNGDVPRNVGRMPALVHMDMNVSRTFQLGAKKPENTRTLAFNARSANLLNRTNATAVGTVASSPSFAQTVASEAARRVELGVRFAF